MTPTDLARAARIDRAAALYARLTPAMGPRAAYAAAVKLARLTTASERAQLRTAIEASL
jgi:hypothetical protein